MLSAFKNFLVTFLVAALIFGIVGYFTSGYVSGIVQSILDGEKDDLQEIIHAPEDTDKNENEPKPVEPGEKVPEGESFTMLFVGTDYRPDIFTDYYHSYDEIDQIAGGFTDPTSTVGILGTKIRHINATWIAVVRADKENREFLTCYISPETRVSSPSGDTTLGDIYGRYGLSVLREHVEAMTELQVHYSFVIDGVRGSEFLASMGSVKFELPADVYSGDAGHISASTSIVTTPVTEETTSDESEEERSEVLMEDPLENPNDGDPAEEEKQTEIIENSLVLEAGSENLTDYSVHIINTFKELSTDDVKLKSSVIFDIIEGYLRRCADWSTDELAHKISDLTYGMSAVENDFFDDPYSEKSVIATDLSSDKVSEIYPMLDAIEYFGYVEYVYPGIYSSSEKVYIPDTTTAHEYFAKYSNK